MRYWGHVIEELLENPWLNCWDLDVEGRHFPTKSTRKGYDCMFAHCIIPNSWSRHSPCNTGDIYDTPFIFTDERQEGPSDSHKSKDVDIKEVDVVAHCSPFHMGTAPDSSVVHNGPKFELVLLQALGYSSFGTLHGLLAPNVQRNQMERLGMRNGFLQILGSCSIRVQASGENSIAKGVELSGQSVSKSAVTACGMEIQISFGNVNLALFIPQTHPWQKQPCFRPEVSHGRIDAEPILSISMQFQVRTLHHQSSWVRRHSRRSRIYAEELPKCWKQRIIETEMILCLSS